MIEPSRATITSPFWMAVLLTRISQASVRPSSALGSRTLADDAAQRAGQRQLIRNFYHEKTAAFV